jgi:hypothetical protein
MRKTPVALTLLLLTLSALATLPGPATAFVSATPMSGLFLAQDGTGSVSLAFAPPLNEEAAVVKAGTARSPQDPVPAVCARAPVAGAPAPTCGAAILGTTLAYAPFGILGDGALQLWLSTDVPRLPVRDVIVRLERLNASGAASTVYEFSYGSSGSAGTPVAPRESEGLANAVVFLDTTPRRIALADLRSEQFNVSEGDVLRLVLDAVLTPVTADAKAQVLVHYGAAMPSGAVFPVVGQNAWRVQLGTETLALRMRDDNVTFYPLDNETDQVRAFDPERVGPVVQPSLAEAARLRWGPTPLDEATRIVGSGLAEIWLQTSSTTGANPELAIDVTLQIGDAEFVGVTNTGLNLAQSAGLAKVVVPIHMKPMDLRAGQNVTIDVDVFGVNATKFSVVYGSVNHTSGILIPVLGGGLVRPQVFEDPLPFLPKPGGAPEEPEEPVSGDDPAATDEPAAPADAGEDNEDAASSGDQEITLKEVQPKGRSPGPGAGVLIAVLLVGALLMHRGRAGKPS